MYHAYESINVAYQQETRSITNFVIRIKKLCKNLISYRQIER